MSITKQRIITILVYADIAAAHDYLVETFGFDSGGVNRDANGNVSHAEVSLNGEAIWLHRVSPDYGLRGAAELGAASGMLNVFVDDVDAHHTRSVAAGAKTGSPRPTSPTDSASTASSTPRAASGHSPLLDDLPTQTHIDAGARAIDAPYLPPEDPSYRKGLTRPRSGRSSRAPRQDHSTLWRLARAMMVEEIKPARGGSMARR